ncbi:MAG: S9 family peptidase, partial [Chloroflexi bacterium]
MPAIDIDSFLAIPRVASLHLNRDGSRLVATVQTVAADGKRFAGALWELDPEGGRDPVRLTQSARGDTAQGFLPDGSIVFTSVRPDPESTDTAAPEVASLWLLPAGGGEARRILAPAAGVDRVAVARDVPVVVAVVAAHPGTTGLEEDRLREQARIDAGVSAQLIEEYPSRWWDHRL